jgi:peroxiredoxin family protein
VTVPSRIDRLSIAVHSGQFDRVHYALVLAAAAIAVGTPVTLFFTQWATRALLAAGPDESPGWSAMTVGEPGLTPMELDARFAARGVGTFEELLAACTALGVRFLVCEAGLLGAEVTASQLRKDVPVEITGAVTFLGDVGRGGACLFV